MPDCQHMASPGTGRPGQDATAHTALVIPSAVRGTADPGKMSAMHIVWQLLLAT